MRAAVSGSQGDIGLAAELASVLQQARLDEEARQVLASMPPGRRLHDRSNDHGDGQTVIAVVSGTQVGTALSDEKQPVRIEQLSPTAFATISRAEAGPVGSSALPPPAAVSQAGAASQAGAESQGGVAKNAV